jgi:hypothetical protein
MHLHCLLCDLGIVITDLDDSDDETDTKSAQGIDISTALLERIKDHRMHTSMSLPIPSTSNALVLFRPLMFSAREVAENDEPADVATQSSPSRDDSMDVEP